MHAKDGYIHRNYVTQYHLQQIYSVNIDVVLKNTIDYLPHFIHVYFFLIECQLDIDKKI